MGSLLFDYIRNTPYNALKNMPFSNIEMSEEGYGKVLSDIYAVYKIDGFDEKCRISLLYFSIMTSKVLLKKSEEDFEKFYGGSIFRYILKNPTVSVEKQNKFFVGDMKNEDEEQRAEEIIQRENFKIDFELEGYEENDILNKIETGLDKIYSTMTLVMICSTNIDKLETLWEFEKHQDSTDEGEGDDEQFEFLGAKSAFVLDKNYSNLKPSIDCLINNIFNYEDFIHKFISGLFNALQNKIYISDKNKEELINKIINYEAFHLDNYKEWKAKYNIKNMADFLPLQSAEIMFHIADRLLRFNIPEGTPSFMSKVVVQRIKHQMDIIVQELKKIDDYYGFENEKSYSLKIQEIVNLLKVFQF